MKPETIGEKVLWKGRYLRSLLIEYRNSAGDVISWEAFQRVGVKGIVAVIPFTPEGDVILVKQFRPPVNRYVIEFPAGLNDKNETLEEVAARELLEETGYKADNLRIIAEGPLSPGASTEILTVFLATDVLDSGKQRTDDVEEIEVVRIPSEGFNEKLLSLMDDETFLDLKIPGLFELALRKIASG